MLVDKDFCCSSYLAFRYIERKDIEFFPGLKHVNAVLPSEEEITFVKDEYDIDNAIRKVFDTQSHERLGILLSGGMDSACLASYMSGCDAYTFRFNGGNIQSEELARAEKYAKRYKLVLHYIDILPEDLVKYLPVVIRKKQEPVHSIEPQIYKAAIIAKQDGITKMVIGDGADYVFYGMDKLISKDWDFNGFVKRYTYLEPEKVLKNPSDVSYLFERYRINDKIDYMSFMDVVATEESYTSYKNAFEAAGLSFIDPYERLKMGVPVDLNRIRNGESKYFIRSLFKLKYPDIKVPEKNPMPRPVEKLLTNWEGPKRKEFIENINIDQFSADQKWQIYCLEQFLNLYDS